MAGAKVLLVLHMRCFGCNFSGRSNKGVTSALRLKATKQVNCAMRRAELYYYFFALQGYLKVTVMVLGPGDEAPVSSNNSFKNS